MKKQSSGLYRTKVTIGHDQTGKPVYKWISARTKKELEDKKRETIAFYITGTGISNDTMFTPYIRKWFVTYKSGRSNATRAAYNNVIENHIIPAFDGRTIRSISASDIQAFINSLKGYSSSIIGHSHSILNGVFKAAIRDRVIDRNPAEYIEKPEAPKSKEKRVLSADERKRIESAIATSEHGLFVAMIYYTGMRIGEACGVQWGDINWKDNMIHIQRNIDYSAGEVNVGTLKTKSSNRYVPIAAPLLSLLRARPIGLPTAYIHSNKSGDPISYYTARSMFAEVMLSAGLAHRTGPNIIDIKPEITPHALRHNFITICYEKGIDAFTASKLAGHSNPQVTMNIYTHLSKDHLKELNTVIDKMFI